MTFPLHFIYWTWKHWVENTFIVSSTATHTAPFDLQTTPLHLLLPLDLVPLQGVRIRPQKVGGLVQDLK